MRSLAPPCPRPALPFAIPCHAPQPRPQPPLCEASLQCPQRALTRYFQPPTEQYTVGWGILDKYGGSCAKYCPGAAWHGRKASHITRFQERLALGARHHLSGPMTKTELHY